MVLVVYIYSREHHSFVRVSLYEYRYTTYTYQGFVIIYPTKVVNFSEMAHKNLIIAYTHKIDQQHN